jgi:imidazolonepropionase-like amidohydrolase
VPQSAPVLIRNATVLTGTGARLDNTDVLITDGKVSAVGSNLTAPANSTIVDGTGRWVTPGLIDIHSHLGVYPSPAHGLPPEAALAALTRNPAEIFGVADRNGSIERGRPADLVLWSGDPLEVTTLADAVFIQGVPQPMHSRQTELRDRYLTKLRAHAAR